MSLSNIKPLDGLRAIAIIFIILYHYFNLQLSDDLFSGSIKYLKYATFWMWSGVDLFFILSGFLIGRILLYYKGVRKYFKTFYMRRIFRIFPPYYLVLIVYILFIWIGLSADFPWLFKEAYPLYSYVFYLQNFWMAKFSAFGAHWLGVTWSLAIEEQFYLILPFVIGIVNKKYLPYIFISFIIIAPIFRILLPGVSGYVLLPARMDALFLGVLLAFFHLNGSLEKTFKHKSVILFIAIAILTILLFVSSVLNAGPVIIHTLLTLSYGIALVLVLVLKSNHFIIKILSIPLFTYIAWFSYMIYLTHQIFSGLLHQMILNQNPQIHNLRDLSITLLALFTTLSFSALSYFYFEKPLLNLGKKYKYSF